MAKTFTLEVPENNKVYFATLLYARAWLNFDSNILAMVNAAGGQLTGPVIRLVGREYGIARGVLKKKEPECCIQLAGFINGRQQNWPVSMEDRATFCAELTSLAKEKKFTKKAQSSAMTKLMWFLKPDGWTMFDELAADGMGIAACESRAARMTAFYKALVEKGFPDLDHELRQVIETSAWPTLPAARILDVMLMRRDREIGRNSPESAMAFLMALPKDSRESLHVLACEAQRVLSDNILQPV